MNIREIILSIILGIFLNQVAFSQLLNKKDTINIEFKAKLLTLTTYGVNDSINVIQDVVKQKIIYIKNPSKNIILMQIPFSQSNFGGLEILGSCSFYIAYNIKMKKFYRLGGFNGLDISSFFNDLKYLPVEDRIELLDGDNDRYGKFNLECLLNYHNSSSKKKRKKGNNCFKKCSDELFTILNEN